MALSILRCLGMTIKNFSVTKIFQWSEDEVWCCSYSSVRKIKEKYVLLSLRKGIDYYGNCESKQ